MPKNIKIIISVCLAIIVLLVGFILFSNFNTSSLEQHITKHNDEIEKQLATGKGNGDVAFYYVIRSYDRVENFEGVTSASIKWRGKEYVQWGNSELNNVTSYKGEKIGEIENHLDGNLYAVLGYPSDDCFITSAQNGRLDEMWVALGSNNMPMLDFNDEWNKKFEDDGNLITLEISKSAYNKADTISYTLKVDDTINIEKSKYDLMTRIYLPPIIRKCEENQPPHLGTYVAPLNESNYDYPVPPKNSINLGELKTYSGALDLTQYGNTLVPGYYGIVFSSDSNTTEAAKFQIID